MKNNYLLLIASIAVFTGCNGNKDVSNITDDLITIDVTAEYPEKELILQDFMDVEYIPLETTDDFITEGRVWDVSDEYIIMTNKKIDGNIFIYDRKGNGVKILNRRGNGGEEYSYILGIVYDKKNQELFVNDHMAQKIFVYDLDGKYKRTLNHVDKAMLVSVFNFDNENLICHNGSFSYSQDSTACPIYIISKQDGNIVETPAIRYDEKITTSLRVKDEARGATMTVSPSTSYPLLPFNDNWSLFEVSSDTVYRYSTDHEITPFIVRTPSIQSMDPEVMLFPSMFTDQYYFLEAVKKEFNFNTNTGFPSTDLVYDTADKTIYKYTVYNDDYATKEQVSMKSRPLKGDILSWQTLEAYKLIEAYENGELKGRLKEIASTLKEDSNPVIMLLKSKQ